MALFGNNWIEEEDYDKNIPHHFGKDTSEEDYEPIMSHKYSEETSAEEDYEFSLLRRKE